MDWKCVTRTIDEEDQRLVRAVRTSSGCEIIISSRPMTVSDRTDEGDAALQHMVAALPQLMAIAKIALATHQDIHAELQSAAAAHPESDELRDDLADCDRAIAEIEGVIARAEGRLS